MVEYERERERTIAKNKQRMRELGVGASTGTTKAKSKRGTNRTGLAARAEPTRRSGRARTAVKSYSDEDLLSIDRAVGTARAARPAYEPEPSPEALCKSAVHLPERRGNVPRHSTKGYLVFEDRPDFKPNLTPAQVIAAGSWGGCYFHPEVAGLGSEDRVPSTLMSFPRIGSTDWTRVCMRADATISRPTCTA